MDALSTSTVHDGIMHALSRGYTNQYQDKDTVSLNGFRELFVLDLHNMGYGYSIRNKKDLILYMRYQETIAYDKRGCPYFIKFRKPFYDFTEDILKIKTCTFSWGDEHIEENEGIEPLDEEEEEFLSNVSDRYGIECEYEYGDLSLACCDFHFMTAGRTTFITFDEEIPLTNDFIVEVSDNLPYLKNLRVSYSLPSNNIQEDQIMRLPNLCSFNGQLVTFTLHLIGVSDNEPFHFPEFVSQDLPLLSNLRDFTLFSDDDITSTYVEGFLKFHF